MKPLPRLAVPPLPLALLALGLARLVVAGTNGLVIDEVYYATWSRRLAAGFFDHPPAVAWMIRASTALAGEGSLGVRAGAVLAGLGGLLALWPHAKDRGLFLLLAAGMPVLALGGLVATPDAPLCLGWALALAGAARGGRGGWLLAGLGAGLAGLGKYTGWGLWPLFLLLLPRELPQMWPGVLLTLGLLAPNLLWNAQHDWLSVRFQLDHGLGAPTMAAGAGSPAGAAPAPGVLGALGFFAAQLGLAFPVVGVAACAWWLRGPGEDRVDRLCWGTSLLPVAFFTLASAFTRGEANWAAPAWIGAALGLARAGARGQQRTAWYAALGGWLGLAATGLLVVHLYRPWLPLREDPAARLGEGRELAEAVAAWGVPTVYTVRYQEAAALSWYAGLDAQALPGVDRMDQYDLWPTRWASPALFLRPYKSGVARAVDPFCRTRGAPALYPDEDGGAHLLTDRAGRRWQLWLVSDCGAR